MSLIKSKKFWVAIAGVVAVGISHFLGWDEGQIKEVLAVVIAYIMGQGLADFGKSAKK